ncbi:uncharacterized protein ATNIH1004_001649 [Aspergillus tanneri]|uniref:Uncharacterized protein n=1 Tax=Aspergillus tanneri TaxID=1220188 RepID=A0A5M9N589_9EURO|nr:uncharacterized protein ATNIH1004_001649 [Aspergillus tanneri]KAA8652744.1 hypothetical protein ATNIH1004_001649 [Aspergillus tanneri]
MGFCGGPLGPIVGLMVGLGPEIRAISPQWRDYTKIELQFSPSPPESIFKPNALIERFLSGDHITPRGPNIHLLPLMGEIIDVSRRLILN